MCASLSSAFSRYPNHLLVPTIQHIPAIHSAFTCPIESIQKAYLSAFIFDYVLFDTFVLPHVASLSSSCGNPYLTTCEAESCFMCESCILTLSHKSQILPYLLNHDRSFWCWYYWWFGPNNYLLWDYTVLFPTWPGLVFFRQPDDPLLQEGNHTAVRFHGDIQLV